MTFINWSDAEEMLGLLYEYVADERSDSSGERVRNLNRLLRDLADLTERSDALSAAELARELRELSLAQDDELAGDPVLDHVNDCIAELERIG